MTSFRETALLALFARLQTIAGPEVLREAVVPERIPAGGLLILRDGDPGTPEITLSPTTYWYDHTAHIEVIVQDRPGQDRAATLDALLLALGAALAAAPARLGGAVETLRWGAARTQDIEVAAGPALKGATVDVFLSYHADNPLT